MGVYTVATTRDGARVWFVNWQMAASGGLPSGHSEVRDATPEESELMEKVVWDRDTPNDLDRLRDLIQHRS